MKSFNEYPFVKAVTKFTNNQKKTSKYYNKKTTIDGIKFDSKKEGNYYLDLKMMEKAGEIKDLVLQPRFELLPKIKWDGKTLCKRSYVADFMYFDFKIMNYVVVDVKGFKTNFYKLKLHMFLLKYPDYAFKEV